MAGGAALGFLCLNAGHALPWMRWKALRPLHTLYGMVLGGIQFVGLPLLVGGTVALWIVLARTWPETVTVSATPFRGSLGTTTGSLSYLSTEQLRAGMRNLGNSHYAAMLLVNAPSFGNQPARYYYPGEPRNFYLGLRYQW